MNYKDNTAKTTLKKNLMKLDKRQLKLFFSIIVHYWLTNKSFISKMNFFHMWCKLNDHCGMVDASFPDPHIDHKLTTAYCQAHPFYFIDMLEPELVINLFCEYLDTRIDILTMVVNKLLTGGIPCSRASAMMLRASPAREPRAMPSAPRALALVIWAEKSTSPL